MPRAGSGERHGAHFGYMIDAHGARFSLASLSLKVSTSLALILVARAGSGERHGAHFGYMIDALPPGPDGRPPPPGFDYPGVKQALAMHKAQKEVRGCVGGSRPWPGCVLWACGAAPCKQTTRTSAIIVARPVALQVKKAGEGQMGAPGAYSVMHGHRKRELWPQEHANPVPHCGGCRGALLRACLRACVPA